MRASESPNASAVTYRLIGVAASMMQTESFTASMAMWSGSFSVDPIIETNDHQAGILRNACFLYFLSLSFSYCTVLGASVRLCTMPYQRQFVCVLRSTSLNLVTPEPLISALKTLYIVLSAGLAGKT